MSIYVGQTVTVTATVTANGTPLSGATVTGSYSGPASGNLTFSESSTAGVYVSSMTVRNLIKRIESASGYIIINRCMRETMRMI